MVVAARLAERLGLADASVGTRIRALVARTRLPADLPPRSASALLQAMRQDKKVQDRRIDRKSTRLNSSHGYISYAVFCLKKKKKKQKYSRSIKNKYTNIS